jgi:uncharacterized protein
MATTRITSRSERLNEALYALQRSAGGVEASAIVSVDGLIIASALPSDTGEDRVAAMSAAMLSLGERIAMELSRGEPEQVYVRGNDGYVLLMSVGQEAVLTVLAGTGAKLGLVFLEMRRAVNTLETLI